MKHAPTDGVSVSIMGKEFIVACSEQERAALVATAGFLDKKMREVQASGRVIGTERTAIMAALNIAHELLELRGALDRGGGMPAEINQKLRLLQNKIDAVLHQ